MKRKICVVTATRAEYGLLRWLMEEIRNDNELELQLIVTGAHLSSEHGFTYAEIEKDGFVANEKVPVPLARTDAESIVKAMGCCLEGMGSALGRLRPDLLIVLGDRYELLPICSAAVVMRIPIAHISGGDITEGAIDDQVRHAVTKMALLHFPGTAESARRIIQMGEHPSRVFIVGEPGLDSFHRIRPASRTEMASELDLKLDKKWVLLTYHPETLDSPSRDLQRVEDLLRFFLAQDNIQIVATGANADCGGNGINLLLQKEAGANSDRIKFFSSLGHDRYIRFLHHAYCMVGNSSSGIVEAPVLNLPVINVGNRQKGRYLSRNIVPCGEGLLALQQAFDRMRSKEYLMSLQQTEAYYGDGHTAHRILMHLKEFRPGALQKNFYEK